MAKGHGRHYGPVKDCVYDDEGRLLRYAQDVLDADGNVIGYSFPETQWGRRVRHEERRKEFERLMGTI